MDFILNRLPIYDKYIISDESKIKILISILNLLILLFYNELLDKMIFLFSSFFIFIYSSKSLIFSIILIIP